MENNNIQISIMNLYDLNEIKAVLETAFDDFWSYSIFKSELENPNSIYFVLRKSNEIIGFAGILTVLDTAEVTNIVIKKNQRGNGLSKILLQNLIKYCKNNNIFKINLEVNSNNLTAINLYESHGFKKVGCRRNYYKDGDALLLTKLLQAN